MNDTAINPWRFTWRKLAVALSLLVVLAMVVAVAGGWIYLRWAGALLYARK